MGGNISPSVGCSPDLVYQGEIKQSAVIQPLEGGGVNMLELKRPSECINVSSNELCCWKKLSKNCRDFEKSNSQQNVVIAQKKCFRSALEDNITDLVCKIYNSSFITKVKFKSG